MLDPSLNKRRRQLSISTSPFETTTSEFIPASVKTKSAKLYSKTPKYIAKVIHPENLSEEKDDKPLNASQKLRFIPEEPAPLLLSSKSRAVSLDLDAARSTSSPLKNNIFRSDQSTQSIHPKGPLYRNGRLVKHSVVGPTDYYEKVPRRGHYYGLTVKHHDLDSSEAASNDTSMNIFRSSSGKTATVVLDSLVANKRKSTEYPKPKEIKKDLKVPKEEVLAEIDNMKNRQTEFYRLLDKTAGLRVQEKLHVTREQRCIEKFRKTEEAWTKAFEQTGSQLGRSPSESVMFRGEGFREKREKIEELELQKNDLERLGSNFWHLTLRRSSLTKKTTDNSMMEDIPIAFNKTVVYRPRTSVEIVRKPNQMNSSLSQWSLANPNNSSSSSPKKKKKKILDKTHTEYFEERFGKGNERRSLEFRPSIANVQQFMVRANSS